ncbi:BRO family protein [Pseudomonas lundensis]|uniref:BRO-N domain-containing protein n=1 Tax=Serratia proteamaculans TaxID=28151 RepID=UPI00298164F9|nr:BRO family protein [Serratia proteamaculans]MDW5502471.1 BRO family protein [Serratia proteamaculans]MDW5507527.1 BRO family protein [Pseudomonas lundensis]
MTAQTQPTVFSFESSTNIRMVLIDQRPYFVAQDVCSALAIKAVDVALRKLDSDEKGTYSIRTPGGYQSQSVISESGLYTLILRCRDAVTPGTIPYRFRKWVTAEVLPAIRQTGQYQHRAPEVLGDLAGTAITSTGTTMTVRDARRGKKTTSSKAASRIADACVPMIMEAMRDQYHYANSNVGPDEVIPALLSDERNLQITALVEELADNGHNVAGVVREVEVMRYYILQCAKNMAAIATHAAFIAQQTKVQ